MYRESRERELRDRWEEPSWRAVRVWPGRGLLVILWTRRWQWARQARGREAGRRAPPLAKLKVPLPPWCGATPSKWRSTSRNFRSWAGRPSTTWGCRGWRAPRPTGRWATLPFSPSATQLRLLDWEQLTSERAEYLRSFFKCRSEGFSGLFSSSNL